MGAGHEDIMCPNKIMDASGHNSTFSSLILFAKKSQNNVSHLEAPTPSKTYTVIINVSNVVLCRGNLPTITPVYLHYLTRDYLVA